MTSSGGVVTIGIDIGTSGLKVVAVDNEGSVVASASRKYAISPSPQGLYDFNPYAWEKAAKDAVREVARLTRPRRIVAVGIDGQMHGVVPVDAGGRAVRPAILWPDQRASSRLQVFSDRLTEDDRLRLGNPFVSGMAGPMLGWIQREEPTRAAEIHEVVAPKDWLRRRLLPDSDGSEPSDASATLLWDVYEDTWHTNALLAFDIPGDWLPALRDSTAVAGEVSASIAKDWGIPSGVPVATGTADVASALIGSNVEPGGVLVQLGTGAQVVKTAVDPLQSCISEYHMFRSWDRGYYAMRAITNAGLALERVVDILSSSWSELYAAADLKPSRSTPYFSPTFSAERFGTNREGRSGSWTGISARTSRDELLFSALEGVCATVVEALDHLPGEDGARHVRVAGGGSRNDAFVQMLATMSERVVERPIIADVTARGAAMQLDGRVGDREPGRRWSDINAFEPGATSILRERYLVRKDWQNRL